MHAVARLVLHPHINNIQASWVKMGLEGMQACLHAGANDIGGTLINESITRSAGASHGQCVDARQLQELAKAAGRVPWQRTTLYAAARETYGIAIDPDCMTIHPQATRALRAE